MKSFSLLIAILAIAATPLTSFSQDALVTEMAKKNLTTFSVANETFTGNGWNTLLTEVQKSDFVLIGEDHFTNEIPFFTAALTEKVKFDNFICEIDPYSAKILESKIKKLPENQLKKYEQDFGSVFAFYSMEPEFKLLKKLVKTNTSIFGIDQVLMNADRLLCSELKMKTKNEKAKKIYQSIEEKSKTGFENFLQDPSKPMYLITEDFEKQCNELLELTLSKEEREQIEAMKLSAKIYKEQNHHLRVQLMKNNLMNIYPQWENKKTLFKYGAGHVAKGESFLTVHDIGNLVDNIADSKFKNSLHILILGKSGAQASPFKGFPEQPIDENSAIGKALKPLLKAVEGNQWYCFDMHPLKNAVEEGKLNTNDILLSRIIKGFDFIVVIPQVTAATFPKSE